MLVGNASVPVEERSVYLTARRRWDKILSWAYGADTEMYSIAYACPMMDTFTLHPSLFDIPGLLQSKLQSLIWNLYTDNEAVVSTCWWKTKDCCERVVTTKCAH